MKGVKSVRKIDLPKITPGKPFHNLSRIVRFNLPGLSKYFDMVRILHADYEVYNAYDYTRITIYSTHHPDHPIGMVLYYKKKADGLDIVHEADKIVIIPENLRKSKLIYYLPSIATIASNTTGIDPKEVFTVGSVLHYLRKNVIDKKLPIIVDMKKFDWGLVEKAKNSGKRFKVPAFETITGCAWFDNCNDSYLVNLLWIARVHKFKFPGEVFYPNDYNALHPLGVVKIPKGVGSGWIVLSSYKGEGCGIHAVVVNNSGVHPLHKDVAMKTTEYYLESISLSGFY